MLIYLAFETRLISEETSRVEHVCMDIQPLNSSINTRPSSELKQNWFQWHRATLTILILERKISALRTTN